MMQPRASRHKPSHHAYISASPLNPASSDRGAYSNLPAMAHPDVVEYNARRRLARRWETLAKSADDLPRAAQPVTGIRVAVAVLGGGHACIYETDSDVWDEIHRLRHVVHAPRLAQCRADWNQEDMLTDYRSPDVFAQKRPAVDGLHRDGWTKRSRSGPSGKNGDDVALHLLQPSEQSNGTDTPRPSTQGQGLDHASSEGRPTLPRPEKDEAQGYTVQTPPQIIAASLYPLRSPARHSFMESNEDSRSSRALPRTLQSPRARSSPVTGDSLHGSNRCGSDSIPSKTTQLAETAATSIGNSADASFSLGRTSTAPIVIQEGEQAHENPTSGRERRSSQSSCRRIQAQVHSRGPSPSNIDRIRRMASASPRPSTRRPLRERLGV